MSMGFSRQKYWSGFPFPRIELRLLQDSGKGDSLPRSHLGSPNRIIEDVREPDYCFIPPEFLISVDEG